ncbi:hypothetical protein MF271_23060 (plasmid) [Deinococcus sp. KNUC1210]|uniref:DUF7662 domain-containing protein n=1 Tax=Deinococcus sp. KNUC1210 TaxID=2917691 RepID=UPI001EEFCF30|nr:hypothetical protein [Deinococcus sp. KNUC1210]ULH18341.1 hypothetical protein MF271_23060 [Deinococcus sp. KNUC1210]
MKTLTVQLQDGERILLSLETATTAQPHDVLNAFAALLNTDTDAPSASLPPTRISGKYAPLADYLKTLEQPSIQLTFPQIEHLLGFALPDSASEHRAWWANDVTHSQARAWTAVGWQSSDVDLTGKSVKFIRSPHGQAEEAVSDTPAKPVTFVIGGIRVPITRRRRSN